MLKGFLSATAALAFVSLASLVPAQAGGATSAASKYNASYSTQGSQAVVAQTVSYKITEFSSSSAPPSKSSGSKR